MQIMRVTAKWTGFTGAPGYSVFHFDTDAGFWDGGVFGDGAQATANGANTRVYNSFFEAKAALPSGVQVRTEAEVEVLDSDTGELIGVLPVSPETVTGSGTGASYSAPSGAVVNWGTNDYRFGRRIRGRTFLVPLSGSTYEDDGTLTSTALSTLRAFGTEMRTGAGSANFGVWSRPRNGSGGVFATATTSSVPDMAAILRSRRD